MKASEYIKNKIDRFFRGYVFTYVDFVDKVKEALVKSLNRLAESGRIMKLAKGNTISLSYPFWRAAS